MEGETQKRGGINMATIDKALSTDDITQFLNPDTDSEEMRSIKEELLKDFDPLDLFRAHKEDLAALERSSKLLEEIKASYDPKKHSKAFVEDHYFLHRDILFHAARRFNPLSDYGKEMLSTAVEYRKEYEKKHGTLISSITKNNADLFSEVLSKDTADQIKRGKCRGIGALKSDKEGTFAAGALGYYLDKDPLDDTSIIRINWLYVDEDCRYMGVGGSLIGEMLYQMTQHENISAITIDYPVDIPEYEEMGNLLQEWHFSFTTGLSPDFICTISEIEKTDELKKYASKANAMKDLKEKDLKIPGFPEGSFDRELSFYTGDIKDPDSILLGHLCPSGTLRVEHIHCKPGSEKNLLFVIAAFLYNTAAKLSKDSEIIIPVEAIEIGEVLDKLVPSQKTDLIVEGVLLYPEGNENFTSSDVKALLDSLDK